MINYKDMDVRLMTEEDMAKLKEMKFVDTYEAPTTEGVLTRFQLPEETRVYRVGSIVTMDFREDRLNVVLYKDKDVVHHAKRG